MSEFTRPGYHGRPIRFLDNSGDERRACELCERPYVGSSGLVGLCHDCCKGLESGKIAAKGMQQEAKALEARRASR